MHSQTKILLLATAAAVCITAPAFAQSIPPSNPPATATPTELQEVVVTARKTAENVQTIPEQVAVFNADKLEKLSITGIEGYRRRNAWFLF